MGKGFVIGIDIWIGVGLFRLSLMLLFGAACTIVPVTTTAVGRGWFMVMETVAGVIDTATVSTC